MNLLLRFCLFLLIPLLAGCAPRAEAPTESDEAQVVLAWEREGGLAGFCDRLVLFADGRYRLENCKSQSMLEGRLSESQLGRLTFYAARLKPFNQQTSDPAIADAMTLRMDFYGNGQNTASADEQQALGALAAEISMVARASASPDAEREAAQQVLAGFLAALNRGEFAAAAGMYGGETDTLQSWNPDIENDLAGWLERGCAQNGLQCLPVRAILYRGPDSRGGYQFLVEFSAADGSLFQQGPCCGDESEGPFPTSFKFSVLKSGDHWLVMDLPPYLP